MRFAQKQFVVIEKYFVAILQTFYKLDYTYKIQVDLSIF